MKHHGLVVLVVFVVSVALLLRAADAGTVFAVGDLHGDNEHAQLLLSKLGELREAGDQLIQLGDQVNKEQNYHGLGSQDNVKLLAEEKRAASVLGNHEVYLLLGRLELQYLVDGNFKTPGTNKEKHEVAKLWLGRGSELRKELMSREAVMRVGDTLFLHAGIYPQAVKLLLGNSVTEENPATFEAFQQALLGKIHSAADLVRDAIEPFFLANEGKTQMLEELLSSSTDTDTTTTSSDPETPTYEFDMFYVAKGLCQLFTKGWQAWDEHFKKEQPRSDGLTVPEQLLAVVFAQNGGKANFRNNVYPELAKVTSEDEQRTQAMWARVCPRPPVEYGDQTDCFTKPGKSPVFQMTCENLHETFKLLGMDPLRSRMVVGHTQQDSGIESFFDVADCRCQLFLIDTAISRYAYRILMLKDGVPGTKHKSARPFLSALRLDDDGTAYALQKEYVIPAPYNGPANGGQDWTCKYWNPNSNAFDLDDDMERLAEHGYKPWELESKCLCKLGEENPLKACPAPAQELAVHSGMSTSAAAVQQSQQSLVSVEGEEEEEEDNDDEFEEDIDGEVDNDLEGSGKTG